MKTLSYIFFVISGLYYVYIVPVFSAIQPSDVTRPGNILPDGSLDAADSIGSMISWMIGLSAILTILAVTWAGISMVLAIGDEEKMKKSRQTMIYAFIGLIVAGLAYGTVKFITNLNLNTFL